MLLQCTDEGSNGRSLLADGHIDTIDRLACLIETLLVDDGINGDGGLTRLTVADDELTLSATDGNHRVDGLQACLQRFLHGLTIDNAGSLAVERHFESISQIDVAFAVDSLSQRINDASKHVVVDTDGGDTFCTLHNLSFLNTRRGAKEHAAHIVFLQVHHDSHCAVLKLQQFVGFSITKTVNTGHAVADGEHGAHLVEFLGAGDSLQLVEQHLGYFAWFDFI